MDRYMRDIKHSQLDSDDVSTDDGIKRKSREEEGEDGNEGFKKSKKMQRTPQKRSQEKPDEEKKLDKILELMKDLKTEVQQIRMEQKDYREEIEKLRTENDEIKEENKKLKKENIEIKAELKEIRNSVERLEKEKRAKNVVMTGLKIDSSDSMILREAMENFVKKHLEIEVKVRAARKIGPKTCLIELEEEEEKRKVMLNKAKLRNLTGDRIFINDDVTKREREMKKNIRKIAQEERNKGKDVKIGFRKLTVNGKEWRWNREEVKLEEVKSKN